MSQTETKPDPVLEGVKKRRKVHITALLPDGSPADQCLCGYLWDVLNATLDGPRCKECFDLAARLGYEIS